VIDIDLAQIDADLTTLTVEERREYTRQGFEIIAALPGGREALEAFRAALAHESRCRSGQNDARRVTQWYGTAAASARTEEASQG
jgi:hypothetical protein